MHSECIEDQEEGLKIFQREYDNETVDSLFKGNVQQQLQYMKRHHDIIKRFSRFPHRNAILNRQSTKEEIEYLTNGGDTFDARAQKQ